MRRVDQLLRATALAEARHFWFHGFRAFVTPLVRRAIVGRPNPLLLDCGCGTGANVEMLGAFGRAFGFDLTEIGLRIGREAGRRRLARASVTAVPFPSAAFDVVTSFDVLYALEGADQRTAIAEMYRLLKPGGFAIVNVAAMKMLRGDHSAFGGEVHRYSRQELRTGLEAAGFEILRLTYTNATLFAPLAVLRLLQRRRGLRAEAAAQREILVPPPPINTIMTAVVRLESVWLRWFDAPFGSSLLCLARKPAATLGTTTGPAEKHDV
jgi:SAM-dependent methyltransferase